MNIPPLDDCHSTIIRTQARNIMVAILGVIIYYISSDLQRTTEQDTTMYHERLKYMPKVCKLFMKHDLNYKKLDYVTNLATPSPIATAHERKIQDNSVSIANAMSLNLCIDTTT